MADARRAAPSPSPVAIIEPVGEHGGMHYYDFGLACGLRDAGVEAIVYTCDETDGAEPPVQVQRSFRGIYGAAPRESVASDLPGTLQRKVEWILTCQQAGLG